MAIETIQSGVESTRNIKIWTPNTIGAFTFFLGFPSGITLASINWFKLGMKWKAFVNILIGIIGIVIISLMPENLTRSVALLINLGFVAYIRYQMKADIESLNDYKIEKAHWFNGLSISIVGWVTAIVILVIYSFLQPLIPGTASYYYAQGNSYAANADFENAITNYSKAIELDPKDSYSYTNRGHAYVTLDKLDLAIMDFNKAIELNLKDYFAYNNRGYIYYLRDDYDRAIDDYTTAIQIDPSNCLAQMNRGHAYYDNGNYELAIADFTNVLEIESENYYAYHHRGLAYEALQQIDLAIKDLEKVLEITADPNLRQEATDELQKLKGE